MADDVREFYDEFAGSVLLRDFLRPNLRQDAIKRLCDRFIAPGARVLEIGCGAGIITRHLSERAASVFGVDISGNNIRIASKFATASNVELAVADIIAQPGSLDGHGPFDAVLLADVIEHIPRDKHGELFATIERVLSERGRVLLTFPSPEYQEYITAHEPATRQVIDETVELRELLAVTSLKPIHFTYRSIFNENQYVHLVLERALGFEGRAVRLRGWQQFVFRVRKVLWGVRNRGFVRAIAAELKRAQDGG